MATNRSPPLSPDSPQYIPPQSAWRSYAPIGAGIGAGVFLIAGVDGVEVGTGSLCDLLCFVPGITQALLLGLNEEFSELQNLKKT
jgi:hypothetical protein